MLCVCYAVYYYDVFSGMLFSVRAHGYCVVWLRRCGGCGVLYIGCVCYAILSMLHVPSALSFMLCSCSYVFYSTHVNHAILSVRGVAVVFSPVSCVSVMLSF